MCSVLDLHLLRPKGRCQHSLYFAAVGVNAIVHATLLLADLRSSLTEPFHTEGVVPGRDEGVGEGQDFVGRRVVEKEGRL